MKIKISEREFNIGVIVFVAAIVLFFYSTIFGLFHTYLTDAAQIAPPFDHFLGTIFLGAAILWFVLGVTDKIPLPFDISGMWVDIITGLLFILSICFYCGFWVGVYK